MKFLDSILAIRADREETAGQLGVAESWAPLGHASPLHVHTHEDEGFFVIDGEMQFWRGDEPPFRLEAGGLAWLPRGRSHAFVVTSPSARFLTIATPGGFEDLFRTGTPTSDPTVPAPGPPAPEDLERAMTALTALGVTILGPPPAL
ncbi:cupin domain-containing protein [Actinomycetospora aeridis]|uniref:Cupin domain-containing protein n=1 Tax=Actinomycetospora aeridis TaxID=3129231 RepID=A0ABU8N986_9PSEU